MGCLSQYGMIVNMGISIKLITETCLLDKQWVTALLIILLICKALNYPLVVCVKYLILNKQVLWPVSCGLCSAAELDHKTMFGVFLAGPVVPGDVEKGSKASVNSNLGEILPVYRQDSHLAVQGGSHSFPGEGTYLLKFDNSYSLWRNKTLYYRVYYSAWGTKRTSADECFENIYIFDQYIDIYLQHCIHIICAINSYTDFFYFDANFIV